MVNPAIGSAFDRALEGAVIALDSLRLVDDRTVAVTINGEEWTAHVYSLTVDGLRDAAARALRDYCAVKAVAEVAK